MTDESEKRKDSCRKTKASTPARTAAVEATRLLGKWLRVARGHVSFGMGCSCGVGMAKIQARDFELQILDYLYGKHSRASADALLALMRDHADYRPGEAGSITELLRAIANGASAIETEPQLALLDDLERSIDSFDEVHRG